MMDNDALRDAAVDVMDGIMNLKEAERMRRDFIKERRKLENVDMKDVYRLNEAILQRKQIKLAEDSYNVALLFGFTTFITFPLILLAGLFGMNVPLPFSTPTPRYILIKHNETHSFLNPIEEGDPFPTFDPKIFL